MLQRHLLYTGAFQNFPAYLAVEQIMISYTLLKSYVTRRDHVSVVMDPMNAGSRIVNFVVNYIRDGTVFA